MRSSKEWRRALEKARQVNNCSSFFFLISFPEIRLFFIWLLDYYYVYSCSKKFLKVFVVVESLPYLNIYLSIYFFAAIRFLIFSIEFCHFKKIMNWILKNFGALIVILFLMTLSNTFLVHKNSRVNYMCLNFIKAYTL